MLSFEYTTTLLSEEGGEGRTGTATMFRKMLAVIEVLKISECGVVKVATKDGTVKLGILPVAPERHLQKLKRLLFAETSWAMGQECPQKLLVAPC